MKRQRVANEDQLHNTVKSYDLPVATKEGREEVVDDCR